jgi:hypothetical protein
LAAPVITSQGDIALSPELTAGIYQMIITSNQLFSLGLRHDGSVESAGTSIPTAVASWVGLVDIYSYVGTNINVAGVLSDNTVVVDGTGSGLPTAATWIDVATIKIGDASCIGLHIDGTVSEAGTTLSEGTLTSTWTGIASVTMGDSCAFGITSTGTVLVAYQTATTFYDVSSWTDIIQVAALVNGVIGLKSDGTVVNVGSTNYSGVTAWTDIIYISANEEAVYGQKLDGTVEATGVDNGAGELVIATLLDIVSVSAGYRGVIGTRSDRQLVTVGDNTNGQLDVSAWDFTASI